jgi:hypothetical protein
MEGPHVHNYTKDSQEGVNTPPKVPNLFDLAIGFFNHNHMDLDGFYLKCHYL